LKNLKHTEPVGCRLSFRLTKELSNFSLSCHCAVAVLFTC